MANERPQKIVEQKMVHNGQTKRAGANPPNTTSQRPAAPGGSGGSSGSKKS